MFKISQSVCPWQAFSAYFASNSYPSEAPFKCSSIGKATSLIEKH
jgi:hypothetical protein